MTEEEIEQERIRQEIIKHFIKWGYTKTSDEKKIADYSLITKTVWYFKENSQDVKPYDYYRGLPFILNDLFSTEYFSQAKDILDLVMQYNVDDYFLPSFKACLYDHQQFFIDNKKDKLFDQIEKYIAHCIGNSTNKGDSIITIDHAASLLTIDEKTFRRVYIDTNILVPLFITPGGVDGIRARRGYRLSTIEHFIKNMK